MASTANPRYTNGYRRRTVRTRVLAEETHCWICGGEVDKALPPHLDGSPEVDEVVPVSLGGDPFDRSNCHLSHRICNVRRGNGTRTTTPTPRVRPLATTRDW